MGLTIKDLLFDSQILNYGAKKIGNKFYIMSADEIFCAEAEAFEGKKFETLESNSEEFLLMYGLFIPQKHFKLRNKSDIENELKKQLHYAFASVEHNEEDDTDNYTVSELEDFLILDMPIIGKPTWYPLAVLLSHSPLSENPNDDRIHTLFIRFSNLTMADNICNRNYLFAVLNEKIIEAGARETWKQFVDIKKLVNIAGIIR